MIRAGKMLGGVSLLAIAAAFAGASTAAAQEGLGYSLYAALGDSYSSGEGASVMVEGDKCDRSESGWVFWTAADIGAPSIVHAACSGATTADIMAQGRDFIAQGSRTQLDYLPPTEQLDGALITLQIGGNDFRLESECISGVKLDDGSLKNGPIPPKCFTDLEYAYNNMADTVALLASNLDYLYQSVRMRAPNATIVVIGYPHLFSAKDADCTGKAVEFLYNATQRQMLNKMIDAGNAQLKESAKAYGFLAITDEIAKAFDGHEMCTAEEWIVSPEWFNDPARAYRAEQIGHPSDYGHQIMAGVVTPLLPYNVNTNNGTTVNTETPDDGGEVEGPGVPGNDGGEEGLPGGGEEGGDAEFP